MMPKPFIAGLVILLALAAPSTAGVVTHLLTNWYGVDDLPPERVNAPVGVGLRAEAASTAVPWRVSEKPWEMGGLAVESCVEKGWRL